LTDAAVEIIDQSETPIEIYSRSRQMAAAAQNDAKSQTYNYATAASFLNAQQKKKKVAVDEMMGNLFGGGGPGGRWLFRRLGKN
jgi:hypothetical protein